MVILLITSCGNNSFKESKNYIKLVKQNILAQKNKIVPFQIQIPVAIQYQGKRLRDPFKDTSKIASIKNQDNTNPLTNYPLSMLKFLGTLYNNAIFYAYIFAPDNKTYQVKIGDIIGDQNGKVQHIYPNRVEIKVTAGEKGKASRVVMLFLKEKVNND